MRIHIDTRRVLASHIVCKVIRKKTFGLVLLGIMHARDVKTQRGKLRPGAAWSAPQQARV